MTPDRQIRVAVCGRALLSVPLPRTMPPSWKVTVPVAPTPVMVTVKVTGLPRFDVASEEVTLQLVPDLFTVRAPLT